jgi:hypothetical protein
MDFRYEIENEKLRNLIEKRPMRCIWPSDN